MSTSNPDTSEAGMPLSSPSSHDTPASAAVPDMKPPTADAEPEASSSDSDSVDLRSFSQRALEWKEDELDVLGRLMDDIQAAFNEGAFSADQRRIEMRTACQELLFRQGTPALYITQLLVYMACSDDEDDLELLYDRINNAQDFLDIAEKAMRAGGFRDSRVALLRDDILSLRRRMAEYEAKDEGDEGLREDEGKGGLTTQQR